MKQMPVESRLAWLARPASLAMRRTSLLCRPPTGKHGTRELRLGEAVQEVALVLAGIHTLQQLEAAFALVTRA
jgi:hypothetical protein